jgi:hypothetical protein
MSPNFHTVNGKLFLLALLGIVAALAFSRRRPTVPVLLVLMANLAFSLISQRNIEFFALVALPLVVLHLDPEWRALPVLGRVKSVFQREHEGSYGGLSSAVVSILLIVLGALLGLRAVRGPRTASDPIPPWKLRPLVGVLGSVVVFGLIVHYVGVLLGTVFLIVAASAASHEFRPKESVIAGVLLGALAVGVFIIGLKLQLPIWPFQH